MWTRLIVFILMSVKVNAEPICQNSTSIREVDLRQEMGPVRNQGGLGWCFGFTAADLLTHYRLKKKDISSVDQTNMVSAVGVSSLYNREFFSYYSPYSFCLDILISRPDR